MVEDYPKYPSILLYDLVMPWDHSISEPPLKQREQRLFFNAKLTSTQEALAAADRHQAGSAVTVAFCLWKGNFFLVASSVERLQRHHFEHK